ncbi:DUF742 domain-containing protein (plasmid) [Streptomyces sp. NBC_01527]|uniref:DUF742 domain-containing protein n=1 Tax=unclassified Streptomyces TaxID=2593676 RepID=UPI002E125B0D|nr:DUF742 domain-containing protein [Streptomyces sp. NBC_01230]
MIESEWVDDGPLVRPYALVRGRTRARQDVFDLVAFVVALVDTLHGWMQIEPEHTQLLGLCRYPTSVSELSAGANLPIGVVRVLLGDLLDMGAIRVREPVERPSAQLIRDVLTGLRDL